MPKPILSPRSRIPAAKAEALLRCYAERRDPSETSRLTGLSLNTVYEQYARIRWRLIETGYYRDAALAKDEDGLSEATKEALRRRRGLEDVDIFAHAAEIIEWAEQWPPENVLRQLRKIIELTGPLDVPLTLDDAQSAVIAAYIRYARTQLIHARISDCATTGEAPSPFAERVRIALENDWRAYRTATRQLQRR